MGFNTYKNQVKLANFFSLRSSACLVFLTSLILVSSFANAVDSNVLTFYETFNDSNSISANSGTVAGSLNFVPGINGNALSFNNNRIDYPTSQNIISQKGTIQFWAKISPLSYNGSLFDIWNNPFSSTGGTPNWLMFYTNPSDGPYIYTENCIGGCYQSLMRASDFNSWHQIAFSWEGGRYYLYVDDIPRLWNTLVDINLAANFTVGDGFWYGRGRFEMDEFRIYNFRKTDQNIIDEYRNVKLENQPIIQSFTPPYSFVVAPEGEAIDFSVVATDPKGRPLTYSWTVDGNFAGNASSYLFANTLPGNSHQVSVIVSNAFFSKRLDWIVSNNSKPVSTGKVKIENRKLYVDGPEYKIRGYGYQAMPIGQSPNIGYDYFQHPEIYNRDFPKLHSSGANTIRTWGKITNTDFMNVANNSGIKIVMGYWMDVWRDDYGDAVTRQRYIDDFRNYVNQYKDYNAVLMWAIGNEDNLFYTGNICEWYSLANEMARAAYEEEGASYHPTAIINGEIYNIGDASKCADDSSTWYVDVWGSNIFRGTSFGSYFTEFATKTGKPLYISEYGVDAYDKINLREDQDTQAQADVSLWREINSCSVCIGGTLMEYSDEWWKDLTAGIWDHDTGGYPNGGMPDGHMTEEWWGALSIAPGTPNIVTERKVYFDLAEEWGAGNNAPVINSFSPLSNPTLNEGSSQDFSIIKSDSDGDSLNVNWYLDGSAVLGGNDSYQYISDYSSAGDHNVAVVVSDGSLSVSREWLVTVLDAPIACYNNSECDDSNSSTNDVCINPGTPSAYCENNAVTTGTIGARSDLLDGFLNYRNGVFYHTGSGELRLGHHSDGTYFYWRKSVLEFDLIKWKLGCLALNTFQFSLSLASTPV